jgi:hypothetical protein
VYFLKDLPYTKEQFELTQATEHEPKTLDLDGVIMNGLGSVLDWLSIYAKAHQDGRGYLAHYLITETLRQLAERLGKDYKAVLQTGKRTHFRVSSGDKKWFLTAYSGHLVLFEETD